MTSEADGKKKLTPVRNGALLLLLCSYLLGCSSTNQTSRTQSSAFIDDSQPHRLVDATVDPKASAQPTTAPVSDSTSIWHRLKKNFALDSAENPRIAKQRAIYLKNPRHLSRTQEQSRPYIGYILDELAARDMPAELALLPMIESGYKPHARSGSRAAGLWQFIPATGRAFGLSISRWYDGRQDIVASTQAALDYLSRINREFDNDWPLTLAAYNAGEPTVRRAIRKNKKAGKQTDFWSLDLPRETRIYVPKLLALKQIFDQPDKYGVDLKPIDDKKHVRVVSVDTPTDLRLVAKLAEIDLATLRKLNPGFKGWTTGPDGPSNLLLPTDKAGLCKERLAGIPEHKRILLKRHKVGKGDTLKKIAARYKTDIALIKYANNLKGNRLELASTLLVPTPYTAEQIGAQHYRNQAARLVSTHAGIKPTG
jgi:membrane-bound lytic murein transglycosylase D